MLPFSWVGPGSFWMVSYNFIRNAYSTTSLQFPFDSSGHKYDVSINLFFTLVWIVPSTQAMTLLITHYMMVKQV